MTMYEDYYGFTEKPFSLTPDPKYLYKSASHANAFDLLQYAIRRREGFVVITGDIGTGKTTLCRAILEQVDKKTFTALVLNRRMAGRGFCRPFMLKMAPCARVRVTIVSTSVIFLSAIFSRSERRAGMPPSSTTTCDIAVPPRTSRKSCR
jgi:type II secretory pathway predicted ATPase ExeA